jgi:integrase
MASRASISAGRGSSNFLCPAYRGRLEALTGQPVLIGSERVKPGTIRALAVSYYNSVAFRSMKPSTQSVYRNIIDRFCQETDKEGHEHGDKRAATLQREHVVKLMAARAQKPDSANGLRKAVRAMMKHAVEIGLRADDPTRDVRAIRVKSEGFHSWTDAEIAQFENRHPVGSRARLALALLLYTGQRRSDVVRMGRQHIRDAVLHIRQQKTGAELAIPVHPDLAAIVAETPADHLTFLTTQFGQSFKAAGFGNWFREQCDVAGLKHCSAHGLRKAAARRLAEAGCTEHEIAAITGPCQFARGRALHKGGGPKAARGGGDGEGQSANIEWQTCLKVCQKREEPMTNQRENLTMAPLPGYV